jgi:signal transduction histidine kinase
LLIPALLAVLVAQLLTFLVVYLQLRRWRANQNDLMFRVVTWDRYFMGIGKDIEQLRDLIERQDFSSFFRSTELLDGLVRRYESLLNSLSRLPRISSNGEDTPHLTAYLARWSSGDFRTRADVVAVVATHLRHTIGTTVSALSVTLSDLEKSPNGRTDPEVMTRLRSLVQTIKDKLTVFTALANIQGDTPGEEVDLAKELRRIVGLLVLASRNTVNVTHELQEGLNVPTTLIRKLTVPLDCIVENATEAVKDNGRIRVLCKQVEKATVIEISNDGPPISQPVDALYSGGVSTKGGYGQGLVLAKMVVEEMLGGRLSHRNDPDGWVTFTIRIPGGL